MIHLTELAAKKIKEQLDRRGHGVGIRVGVKPTGCSGLAYVLEFVDHLNILRPIVHEQFGVKVYINTVDYVYLDGLTIDWQRQGLNEGFEFTNPNEESRCGCGQSFKIN